MSENDGPEYDVDFREHPEKYDVGRGEEGVFKVEPYKSELLPHWSYADEESAEESAAAIYDRYDSYRDADDFVGMDMARKYLQMGYTRSMRYAKYPGGQKYEDGEEREPREWADADKRAAALVFQAYLERVRDDERYQELRDGHRERHG
ncbi:DUF4385 domain-containing protein [Halogeometricum limi]|uniref:DUF4385 domain-containing protein n=1 Tax=Halogeometricum limi TaxID=555875 RepID=A0A1I6ITA6_9EURY|nr:DUF4385 domain-containing protein [Halogeometricum limi]SFR69977.1 protein of unknown function [Halogeometricum limi]